jgi:L-ornithine Nalpha-acyltransferase
LRFQVFNLELNKGLHSSYETGLDIDEFDPYCNHLIVRDIKNNDVVGTYRMMRDALARLHLGFYSEKEFDLSCIKNLDGETLELGRSCARKDYRDCALLPLMWEAIAEYVLAHQIRYLFGCGSLYTTDVAEVSAIFSLLKSKYYAPDHCRVEPVKECRFNDLSDVPIDSNDEAALFQRLPSLIKAYLRIGALVCGPPALDAGFGTADFLLLLDFTSLKPEYLKRLGLVDVKSNEAPA